MTPAEMRDHYRAIVWKNRNIPALHGLREYTVAIVTTAWSGTHPGDGTEVVTTTAITEADGHPPRVRWLSDKELALGALGRGVIEIGPITPSFSGGGTAIAMLLGSALTTGNTLHVRITGPGHEAGTLFRSVGVDSDRAFHYRIRAEPVA